MEEQFPIVYQYNVFYAKYEGLLSEEEKSGIAQFECENPTKQLCSAIVYKILDEKEIDNDHEVVQIEEEKLYMIQGFFDLLEEKKLSVGVKKDDITIVDDVPGKTVKSDENEQIQDTGKEAHEVRQETQEIPKEQVAHEATTITEQEYDESQEYTPESSVETTEKIEVVEPGPNGMEETEKFILTDDGEVVDGEKLISFKEYSSQKLADVYSEVKTSLFDDEEEIEKIEDNTDIREKEYGEYVEKNPIVVQRIIEKVEETVKDDESVEVLEPIFDTIESADLKSLEEEILMETGGAMNVEEMLDPIEQDKIETVETSVSDENIEIEKLKEPISIEETQEVKVEAPVLGEQTETEEPELKESKKEPVIKKKTKKKKRKKKSPTKKKSPGKKKESVIEKLTETLDLDMKIEFQNVSLDDFLREENERLARLEKARRDSIQSDETLKKILTGGTESREKRMNQMYKKFKKRNADEHMFFVKQQARKKKARKQVEKDLKKRDKVRRERRMLMIEKKKIAVGMEVVKQFKFQERKKIEKKYQNMFQRFQDRLESQEKQRRVLMRQRGINDSVKRRKHKEKLKVERDVIERKKMRQEIQKSLCVERNHKRSYKFIANKRDNDLREELAAIVRARRLEWESEKREITKKFEMEYNRKLRVDMTRRTWESGRRVKMGMNNYEEYIITPDRLERYERVKSSKKKGVIRSPKFGSRYSRSKTAPKSRVRRVSSKGFKSTLPVSPILGSQRAKSVRKSRNSVKMRRTRSFSHKSRIQKRKSRKRSLFAYKGKTNQEKAIPRKASFSNLYV